MLENPFYYNEDAKHQRAYMRRVILGLLLGAFIGSAVIYSVSSRAEPRFQVQNEGVRVVLHDEPCQLKEQITNLPYRVVWYEKGKAVEGCWGARPEAGIAMAYFADKTVGIIPLSELTPVRGA